MYFKHLFKITTKTRKFSMFVYSFFSCVFSAVWLVWELLQTSINDSMWTFFCLHTNIDREIDGSHNEINSKRWEERQRWANNDLILGILASNENNTFALLYSDEHFRMIVRSGKRNEISSKNKEAKTKISVDYFN